MTAKRRRRKFEKKRKSHEHPQPRRSKEAARRETREDGEGEARESSPTQPRVIEEARLHHVSLVPEGEGLEGSFIELTPFQQKFHEVLAEGGRIEARVGRKGPYWNVVPLNEVDPNEYNFTGGWPEGSRIYLNDSEKELFDEVHEQRAAEIEEGIRSTRPPHAKTS